MAFPVIRNFSVDDLIVVHLQGTNRRGRLLEPGRATPSGTSVIGVFSHDGNTIMDHKLGWLLDSDTIACLYTKGEWSRILGIAGLDMHCFPQGTITNYGPIPLYHEATRQDFHGIPLDLTSGWGDPVTAGPPGRDGRARYRTIQCDFSLFETGRDIRLPAFYIRTDNVITVRIHFQFKFLEDTVATNELKLKIQRAMRDVWNHASVPAPAAGSKFIFRCERVMRGQDCNVSYSQTIARATSRQWAKNKPFNIIAHEYGHLLGMVDEYYLDFHLPLSIKKTMTTEQRRQWEAKNCAARLQERQQRGICPAHMNLMEIHTASSHVVDQKMVDAIDGKAGQKLCLRL